MKKKLLYTSILFIIWISFSNAQHIEFSKFELRENLPNWVLNKIDDLKIEKPILVNGDINPFFLEADFNGDSFPDLALYVTEMDTNKKGILIIHGKSHDIHLFGAGEIFGNGSDDFSWLKVWKLYRDKIAYKTIFTEDLEIVGSEEIKLKNIAISVAPSEGTYNLIVYNGEKYEWIQTGN